MTDFASMRAVVEYAIGGGWGDDAEAPGLVRVGVIRGADFPGVARGDVSGLPIRYEGLERARSRELQAGDIVLEISGGTKDRPTGRTVFVSDPLLSRAGLPLIPASFCRLIRVDTAMAVPQYVYYWLQGMHAAGRTWAISTEVPV